MESPNNSRLEAEAGGKESKKLGAFLRTERERMKLSQDQIAQKMRLRPFVIESIENEAWDRLPHAVFVRGFVRSYARTLDLDEKKVIALYNVSAPPEPDILKAVVGERPSHRGRILFMLGALFFVMCVFYYWHVKSTAKEREYLAMVERSVSPQIEETTIRSVPQPLNRDAARMQQENVPQGRDSAPVPEKVKLPEAGLEEDSSPAEVLGSQAESRSPWLVLKGDVKETTWVSIRVDGEKPKKYLFQPGAKPEWKGMKGFEIVIGNAGGMELHFEGKSMENLGRSGQVIRLRLP
ncbi:MAG: DUF4115 domain-containing protein [Deltaproteobacteria bacterium]|nr:DUF4115 domain-containing protein [Deltaproteobacteria bacterium]